MKKILTFLSVVFLCVSLHLFAQDTPSYTKKDDITYDFNFSGNTVGSMLDLATNTGEHVGQLFITMATVAKNNGYKYFLIQKYSSDTKLEMIGNHNSDGYVVSEFKVTYDYNTEITLSYEKVNAENCFNAEAILKEDTPSDATPNPSPSRYRNQAPNA